MNMKPIVPLSAILALIILSSCQTDRGMFDDDIGDFETGDFLGMAYDSENRPCAGAVVRVVGREKRTYVADVNGRFVIHALERGDHLLRIAKEGFESQEIPLSYTSRKQILYVRMVSQASLVDRAEGAMDALEWDRAEGFLARAEAIDPENSRFLVTRGTFDYLRGRPEQAVSAWKKLIDKGHRDPYLYLMIADAFQYGLEDDEMAAEWLGKFLEVRDDAPIRERLEMILESSVES